MGKGYSSSDVPEVEKTPIAPVSPPVSESSVEVAAAVRKQKENIRKSFGSRKTVIAGGTGLGGNNDDPGNTTLG